MKKTGKFIAMGLLVSVLLTGCGQDPKMVAFKNEIDNFCTQISEADTSINSIDAQSEGAAKELLEYLDELDMDFRHFAEIDFPEEFDYLESIADESSSYMTEAVRNYHEAYGGDSYNEAAAQYAKENYSRAYKRVQIIITFLHGEEPESVDLSTGAEEN